MDTDILMAAIAAVFTIASAPVIQWRKTRDWSKTLSVALPVVVSLAIAGVYSFATGALTGMQILPAFLVVYGLQQLVYGTIVKHIDSLREANDPLGSGITFADPGDQVEVEPQEDFSTAAAEGSYPGFDGETFRK
ncbi:hypothetical protein [Glutamicibacter sp.]|uniref:hypothetical protein n=1 Tax=Glutamicibacter sp. TaxID=1931995 RepID=UPI0028BF1629|nr:hypothetical protein [Glutamicibacter sp.]